LGWKLSFVISGKCSKELLETYDVERREVGKNLITLTTRVQKGSSNRNPIVQFLRNNTIKLLTSSEFFVDLIANEMGKL
jgi:2-polyprenyl-6-methoxyphenol hydroxylase-like FAD-dependent oxidoreductase